MTLPPRWIALIASMVMLAGCAAPLPGCTALPGGGQYCLQPTHAVQPFELTQKLDFSFNGQRETLIASVDADASQMRLVGLTPFGHKLIDVAFDNRTVNANMLLDERIQPTFMLAVLQISLWPAEAVRAGLDGQLSLEDATDLRRVLRAGEEVLVVRYSGPRWPKPMMQISLPAAKLSLSIEGLESVLDVAQ